MEFSTIKYTNKLGCFANTHLYWLIVMNTFDEISPLGRNDGNNSTHTIQFLGGQAVRERGLKIHIILLYQNYHEKLKMS